MRYHKRIRLGGDTYKAVGLPCFVTICTKYARKIFLDKFLANEFLGLLKKHSQENDVLIYAYCIMPDHVHLLISASHNKDIISFVREIKSLSTRIAWAYNYRGGIWQTSFYDHFLRNDEGRREVINYIVENPVREGLVDNWRDYQFCGSLVYDL